MSRTLPAPSDAVLRAVNDYFQALGATFFAGMLCVWLGLLPDDTTLARWWGMVAVLAFFGPVGLAFVRHAIRREDAR